MKQEVLVQVRACNRFKLQPPFVSLNNRALENSQHDLIPLLDGEWRAEYCFQIQGE